MTYQYSTFSVPVSMNVRQKTLLEIQVRKIGGVVSACVDNRGSMTVRSLGTPSRQAIRRLIQAAVSDRQQLVYPLRLKKQEKSSEVNQYRRDAITAGLGLVGLQLLRMYSPDRKSVV